MFWRWSVQPSAAVHIRSATPISSTVGNAGIKYGHGPTLINTSRWVKCWRLDIAASCCSDQLQCKQIWIMKETTHCIIRDHVTWTWLNYTHSLPLLTAWCQKQRQPKQVLIHIMSRWQLAKALRYPVISEIMIPFFLVSFQPKVWTTFTTWIYTQHSSSHRSMLSTTQFLHRSIQFLLTGQ